MMNIDGNIHPSSQVGSVESIIPKQESQDNKGDNVQQDPARLELSDMAKNFSKAVQHLKEAEEPRPEELAQGKEIVSNWQQPTDQEIDIIINDLFTE